eukprot:8309291-Ditylum_brightwellii.AAC.1
MTGKGSFPSTLYLTRAVSRKQPPCTQLADISPTVKGRLPLFLLFLPLDPSSSAAAESEDG